MTFPMVSQLTKITTDEQESENAQDDCVAASICAACMYLKGVKTVGGLYTPDNFKDKAVGQSYIGVTAPSQYVSFCASLGVHLSPFNGDPVALIAQTLVQLAKGHPVVFTEPDPYVAASLNWTHVCVFFGYGGDSLTALDPYIGQPVTRKVSEWQKLLCFNQIWIAELTPPPVPQLQPISDDLYVWQFVRKDIPLHADWGIPQSWLRARQLHGVELGSVLDNEVDTPTDRRQLFGNARATWDKKSHVVTWYHAGGHVEY